MGSSQADAEISSLDAANLSDLSPSQIPGAAGGADTEDLLFSSLPMVQVVGLSEAERAPSASPPPSDTEDVHGQGAPGREEHTATELAGAVVPLPEELRGSIIAPSLPTSRVRRTIMLDPAMRMIPQASVRAVACATENFIALLGEQAFSLLGSRKTIRDTDIAAVIHRDVRYHFMRDVFPKPSQMPSGSGLVPPQAKRRNVGTNSGSMDRDPGAAPPAGPVQQTLRFTRTPEAGGGLGKSSSEASMQLDPAGQGPGTDEPPLEEVSLASPPRAATAEGGPQVDATQELSQPSEIPPTATAPHSSADLFSRFAFKE
ncbi:hypothetical protein H696_00299 [Fonticula alba]|uniref:Transcription factor CBF/NF-Y/archaeal histone domain-containing protein n=1 Tax=Fonticula alba TaxID=691883 RepID=A0A058ZFJ1_FONAL|nr:hypothetical protein H696_00299 [Fonticula alba]KCV72721.1 hypothetical protein H696_00299 [Fonticula alba]|eukprot:XP_009492422.1 hypothetical protein H696_00299 [Fonticula alba]